MFEREALCDGCGRSLAEGGDWDVSAYCGWLCRPCSLSDIGTVGGQVPIAGPMSGKPTHMSGKPTNMYALLQQSHGFRSHQTPWSLPSRF